MSSTANISKTSKVIRAFLAVVIAFGLSPLCAVGTAAKAYAGTYNSVTGSSDGTNLTLNVAVSVGNMYYDEANFQVTYADGSTGTLLLKSAVANNDAHVEYNWAAVNGSSVALSNVTSSSYDAKVTIPLNVFGGQAFTLTSGNTRITSEQLGVGSSQSTGQGSQDPASGGSNAGEGDASGANTDGSQGGSQGGSSEGATQGGSSEGGSPEGGANLGGLQPTVSGLIVVDGANEDWAGVSALASNDAYVPEWKLARDTDGNVYFMFDGTASTQWDYNFQWWGLQITQNGQTSTVQIANLANQTGATVQMTNNANHNTPGPYVVEAMIPASYFSDPNASLQFVGTPVKVTDIPVLDGNSAGSQGDAVYNGIVVDGSFSDWDAVTKYDAWCNNPAHRNCIDQAGVVWDGDMVYVYLHETPGGSAAGAGTHGNGLYAITTDLGRQVLVQLNNDGSIGGVEGASAMHVGAQWEIAIPASNLPEYLESINFGLYTASDPVEDDLFVTNITNLNGQGSGGQFSGDIVIDGVYGDWAFYPHKIIEYATAGTQSNVADSEGALYSKDGMLYAHVVTTMPAHTENESGGEFLAAVSIAFNGDRNFKGMPQDGNFYPKFFTVDDAGHINVVNEGTHLPNGTYTFYISDIRSTFDLGNTNFADVPDSEVFGMMKVTVSEGKDEMEFQIDLRKVADYIGADANDFKLIESQFGRLGQEWISTAGTSTAPFVGIGLGIGAVACVLGWRKFYDKTGAGPGGNAAAAGSGLAAQASGAVPAAQAAGSGPADEGAAS